jgi:hypothetical protein
MRKLNSQELDLLYANCQSVFELIDQADNVLIRMVKMLTNPEISEDAALLKIYTPVDNLSESLQKHLRSMSVLEKAIEQYK